MITLEKQTNGNLKILLNDKEELLDVMARPYTDERDALFDMLERSRYIGNGFDCLFHIGLTEAPAIGENVDYEDDGMMADCETMWYFDNYMVLSFQEELKEHGQVIFTKNR